MCWHPLLVSQPRHQIAAASLQQHLYRHPLLLPLAQIAVVTVRVQALAVAFITVFDGVDVKHVRPLREVAARVPCARESIRSKRSPDR